MSNNSYTFRLFKKTPSFMSGVASSFDFFGDDSLNYRMDANDQEADLNSIHSDWMAVGEDMKKAISEHENEAFK